MQMLLVVHSTHSQSAHPALQFRTPYFSARLYCYCIYMCLINLLITSQAHNVSSFVNTDVDECAHTALRNCSPHAECNNTEASYHCTCRHGYTDVLSQNAGASCEGVLAKRGQLSLWMGGHDILYVCVWSRYREREDETFYRDYK